MSENARADAGYLALIQSDRVSARTRAALLARAAPDDPAYRAVAMTMDQLGILRAAAARIVPQPPGPTIDLGGRIDAALGGGAGDGWRFADLPPDKEAYRAGLATLDAAAHSAQGSGFASLDSAAQDALLVRLSDGGLTPDHGLDALKQRRWFEDLRAEAVRIYVAHPMTLARMGYSGIAYGGDGARKQGFQVLTAGTREEWEPVAAADQAR